MQGLDQSRSNFSYNYTLYPSKGAFCRYMSLMYVRELEGALIRVVAFSTIVNQVINVHLAAEAVKGLILSKSINHDTKDSTTGRGVLRN